MTRATHNGTCQTCLRVQASHPIHSTLAKHGHTKRHGFFEGVCSGSGAKPVELDTNLLDLTRSRLLTRAEKIDNATCALDLGPLVVGWDERPKHGQRCQRVRKVEMISSREKWSAFCEKMGDKCLSNGWRDTDYGWQSMLDRQLSNAKLQAKQMRHHVDALRDAKANRHGQPLYDR